MLFSRPIRILNFDNSLIRQTQLLERFSPNIIDLTKIGPASRLWADLKSTTEIKKFLNPQERNTITFLGSGDFHHISSLLIEQFSEPLSVIVFDFHPDWDILPPRLGCGSWVSNILRRKNIEKVILLGVSSDDISNIWVQTGNLNSLKNNRVEIYPYVHRPTFTLLKKVPDNLSLRIERGILYNRIYWQELKNNNLADFFGGVIARLKSKKIYLSIDKDCLKANYSLTNWEEGLFSLEELSIFLGMIKNNLDIAGVDILGDY